MESIFKNVNIDDLKDDKNMNKIFDMMKIYILSYKTYFSNSEYLQENKQIYSIFCKDTIQIFNLLKNELEEELKDDDDDEEDDITEINNILYHINIIIDEFPDDEFINNNSLDEIKNKINQQKLKDSLVEVVKFFDKIGNNMKELNETIKKCCNTLEKSTEKLVISVKINKIIEDLSLKYKSLTDIVNENNYIKLKEDVKWVTESITYLTNIINDKKYSFENNFDMNIINYKKSNNIEIFQDEIDKMDEYNVVTTYNNVVNYMKMINKYLHSSINKL